MLFRKLKEKTNSFWVVVLLSGIVVILVTFISLFNITSQKDFHCKECNVVIFDIDVLRADALPCYGYHRNTAPNICTLAEDGILFERNIAQSNWTLTGIASTMTSLYISVHKVQWAFVDRIIPEISTMAELFKVEGYNTFFVGPNFEKYNFFPVDIDRGFDQTSGLDIVNWGNVIDEAVRSEKPFLVYFQTQRLNMPYTIEESEDIELLEPLPEPEGFPNTKEDYDSLIGDYLVENYTEIFTEKAIKQYPEIFGNMGPDKKEEIRELFIDSELPSGLLKEKWIAAYNSYFGTIEKGGNPAIEYMRLIYDTNIAVVDKEMQQVLNYLGSLDNTIVIIMSQHGEDFGEHNGQFSHHTLYNQILNTPLIIKTPGFKPRRVDTVTQNIDILPTVLELIGASIPEQAQGKSLVSLFKGESDRKRYAVSEIGFEKASIQNYEWKLIANNHHTQDPILELFNLREDPREQTNLVDNNPETVERLFSKLMSVLKESRDKYNIIQPSLPDWVEEERRERLIEQGYF